MEKKCDQKLTECKEKSKQQLMQIKGEHTALVCMVISLVKRVGWVTGQAGSYQIDRCMVLVDPNGPIWS